MWIFFNYSIYLPDTAINVIHNCYIEIVIMNQNNKIGYWKTLPEPHHYYHYSDIKYVFWRVCTVVCNFIVFTVTLFTILFCLLYLLQKLNASFQYVYFMLVEHA